MRDKYFYIGVGFIVLFMLPYVILGENAYITIHDFLDQNVAIMADLKNNGLLTSIKGIVPNMDGLDRSLFPYFTPFDVKMVSYALLPTYWAIISYTFVYKLIAFWGMYLLLNTYIYNKKNKIVSLSLSLGFAFVPFYMELAISGAGFPLMVYAFLNLYNNTNKVASYIAILFYTFNSLLAYGGFFLLCIIFCCLIYDYNQTKKFSKSVIYGVIFMSLIYIIANWGTIYSLFFSEKFTSHRTEWTYTTSIFGDLINYIILLLLSQYHAGRLIAAPILLLFIYIYIKYRNKYAILSKIFFLYCVIAIGVFLGMFIKHLGIQLFITIQFDRFYFFYPSIIFILLSSILYVLIHEKLFNKLFPYIILYGLICGIVFDGEYRRNIILLSKHEISKPTFKEFYDKRLFKAIQKDIGIEPDYKTKVVSLGLYPSVAEVNGFYTLDSYRVNYPIEYKRKFRRVIEGELKKNKVLEEYYDGWGSRCYLFSSDLDVKGNRYLCGKNDNYIVNLCIDVNALKELGCNYILSAVDIQNYKKLGISFINSYSNPDSYYNIRVYKLD